MPAYFVSRHQGAVDWAARRGIAARQVEHLDAEMIKPGDTVIGTLPVHLAAEICARGARYLHLSMDLPQTGRRPNLSADEMDGFGARLEEFEVRRVE